MALFVYPPITLSISGNASEATQLDVLAEVEAINTNTADAATETTQASVLSEVQALNARVGGSLAPVAFDEIALTYVASGNGAGQIETVVYKLATATVKTLTLSYNAENKLSGVAAS